MARGNRYKIAIALFLNKARLLGTGSTNELYSTKAPWQGFRGC